MARTPKSKAADGRGLNPRQHAFVASYLVKGNATQAAIAAGYSEKTAESQGWRLLRNAKVAAAIGVKAEKLAEELDLTPRLVLGEMMRIAFADLGQAFDVNGNLRKLHEMPEDVRRAMAGIEVDETPGAEGVVRKVKFWDKPKALEMLGRHLKLFTEKHEVTGKDGEALTVRIVTCAEGEGDA